MSILERYLARTVIGGTAMVLGVLIALSAFVLLVGQGEHVGRGSYTLLKAIEFTLANMPQQAWELFPLAVLIGSLMGLGQLAAANELTVVRASGVSVWRLARALLLGAVLLALASITIGELIAPNTQRYAMHLKSMAMNQRLTVVDSQGVWAKDGNVFVNVRAMRADDQLTGVYLYEFDAEGRLVSAVVADSATHDGPGWKLQGLRETRLSDDRAEVLDAPTRDWQSSLDPELLDSFVIDYDSLSLLALVRYSGYLAENGLDSSDVDIYLWSRVALPLDVLLMALLALPFAFGPLRSTGTGQRVLIGVLIGIAFYAGNRALLHSGTVYDIDPLVTNFAPTLVLAVATFIALKRVR